MKIVMVKCQNKACDNSGIPVTFNLSDFRWDVECSSGDKPGDMFYKLPGEIHCQKCFYVCSVEVVDIG
jgi:hypothetical protein